MSEGQRPGDIRRDAGGQSSDASDEMWERRSPDTSGLMDVKYREMRLIHTTKVNFRVLVLIQMSMLSIYA